MAITYTWTVANMERNTADGGVTVIHWRCTGADGDTTASSYGTTSHTPDPSDAGFIAFEDVTEAKALEWVWGVVTKDDIESSIANTIDAKLNPTTTNGLPW